ncbi:hypothetical protein diail_2358 [Diaporthe ilicicola]|nr:hypothetical protein diail_2358 [Diaporthe ilicicola]
MKRITTTGAQLRPMAHAQLQVRPFHHTNAASSSSAKGNSSEQSNVQQAQPAAQDSDTSGSASSDKKAESSGAARKKTIAELDAELRLKLEGMSGDGGSAGIEYENGKAEGLKRGVKSNMFRVI